MGKYIIELENDQIIDGHITCPMQIGYRDRPSFIIDTGIDITPYTEPDMEQVRKEAYKEGREAGIKDGMCDAWETARKIASDNAGRNYSIFGQHFTAEILNTHSASEAIEEVRAYEQAQKEKEEQIQVGDEVINQNKTAVVTEITNRYTRIMYSDGSGYALFAKGLTKTGRHFPEIAAVLEKMKKS